MGEEVREDGRGAGRDRREGAVALGGCDWSLQRGVGGCRGRGRGHGHGTRSLVVGSRDGNGIRGLDAIAGFGGGHGGGYCEDWKPCRLTFIYNLVEWDFHVIRIFG